MTLRLWNRLLRWKVRAIPMRLTRLGGWPVMSWSFRKMWPESGLSCPPIWLIRLVLPAPFGPMMT